MGQVYRARDVRLDRTLAVKVLSQHVLTRAASRKRFEREARVVGSLNHPHICALHDVGQQDGLDVLVMEFVQDETLAARLDRGPLPLDLVRDRQLSRQSIGQPQDRWHQCGRGQHQPARSRLSITGICAAAVSAGRRATTHLLSRSSAACEMAGDCAQLHVSRLEGQPVHAREAAHTRHSAEVD